MFWVIEMLDAECSEPQSSPFWPPGGFFQFMLCIPLFNARPWTFANSPLTSLFCEICKIYTADHNVQLRSLRHVIWFILRPWVWVSLVPGNGVEFRGKAGELTLALSLPPPIVGGQGLWTSRTSLPPMTQRLPSSVAPSQQKGTFILRFKVSLRLTKSSVLTKFLPELKFSLKFIYQRRVWLPYRGRVNMRFDLSSKNWTARSNEVSVL